MCAWVSSAADAPAPAAPAPAALLGHDEYYNLPDSALQHLHLQHLQLKLYTIVFSHYCDKARWVLDLLAMPFEEVACLPMQHVPCVSGAVKVFEEQDRSKAARAGSKAVTPTLAVYDYAGTPLFLLQDSGRIARWAVLRAQALRTPAPPLFGPEYSMRGGSVVGTDSAAYQDIDAIEWRLGGVLGREVRRVAYSHMLSQGNLMIPLIRNNSAGVTRALAPLWWLLLWAALSTLMQTGRKAAAAGAAKLRSEFDWLDSLVLERGVGTRQRYLCGDRLSAADVALAALAGPILRATEGCGGGRVWFPPLGTGPPGFDALSRELRARPAGQLVLRLCAERPQVVQAEAGRPAGKVNVM